MRAALRVFCCLRECQATHSNSNSNSESESESESDAASG
ncbi:hypothetical protein LA76x_3502 [Lysobacter antibioticus]|uniref:Uncharacterized protein n=1 Tax=Lysobacter antibioticus TaxID=84531 RepID=A0A0S2FDN9_LYSAN|nr:hypothetical protein LA76x_3502 [Lysobacter antibioticus]